MGRPETAALTGWLFGVTAFLGCVGMAVRWMPAESDPHVYSSSAAMAITALSVSLTACRMTGWAYTDLFSVLMGVGGLSCFLAWRESGRRGWFLWTSVFIGFAIGTKYTAGILAIVLFAIAFFFPGKERRSVSTLFTGGFIVLAVCMPWLIKNAVFTGNPIFPYFFPSANYPAARLAAANLAPAHIDWLSHLLAPIFFTWKGVDSAPGPGTDLGPLLVLFAVPGLFLYRRNSRAHIFSAVLFAWWAAIIVAGARSEHLQQPRVYFVLLPALAVPAGWGWSKLQNLQTGAIRFRRIIGILCVIVVFIGLTREILYPIMNGALQTSLGLHSRDAYLYENSGAYYEAMQTLAGLPHNSLVLMLWEGRGLYAPENAVVDPWLDRFRTDLKQFGSPESVLTNWRGHGYTHILLYSTGMQMMQAVDANLTQKDWESFGQIIDSLPAPQILTGDFYRLYKLP
jgi:hypothetical protein